MVRKASYYLLPTTYYLLPTTYYLLPTTYYLLPTPYSLLPTPYYLLPTTYNPLPTTYYLYYLEDGEECVLELVKVPPRLSIAVRVIVLPPDVIGLSLLPGVRGGCIAPPRLSVIAHAAVHGVVHA
eukprot:scaffold42310_cov40-Phaeocystis_antarctica.AAC.2